MGYTIWPDGSVGDGLRDIYRERMRQEELQSSGKFPFTCETPNGLTEAEKLGVLAEEFGEVAQHVCKWMIPKPELHGPHTFDYARPLREELVQVAAVCLAWIEALDRSKKW